MDAGLSAGQRAVMLLRYSEGLSESATATRLGISPATVRTRTCRAKRRIAKHQYQAAQIEYIEIVWATTQLPGVSPDNGMSDLEYAKALWRMMKRLNCKPPTPQYTSQWYWAEDAAVHAQRVTLGDVLRIVRDRREAREYREQECRVKATDADLRRGRQAARGECPLARGEKMQPNT